jgi:hypothetical protein
MREFRLTSVEEVETQTMSERKVRRGRPTSFVKLPLVWVDKLDQIDASGATYRVAIHLLQRAWRGATTKLPRVSRVSRNGKRAALHQLELAGLISVERRSRKSPIVTMLLVD